MYVVLNACVCASVVVFVSSTTTDCFNPDTFALTARHYGCSVFVSYRPSFRALNSWKKGAELFC